MRFNIRSALKQSVCFIFILILSSACFEGIRALSAEKIADITLSKGEKIRLPYENLQKIIIGDERIVEVQVNYSARQLLIEGKETGETTLSFLAPGGEKVEYRVKVSKKEKSAGKDLRTSSGPAKEGQVQREKSNKIQEVEIKQNSKLPHLGVRVTDERILLEGEVFEEVSKTNAGQVAGVYGKPVINLIKVSRPMIEMDVKIVQIDTVKGESFGENLLKNLGVSMEGSAETDLKPRLLLSATALSSLNILVNHGKAKILSQPHLTCRSGEAATFHSGGEIGFRVSGRQSGGVKFKEYGLILQIEPRMNDKERVESHISLEVSAPTSAPTSSQDIGFTKFNADSHIEGSPDETIIIAGLAENIEHRFKENTPLLGNIPVFNLFFSQNQDQASRRNLIMMVTPTLARVEKNEDYQSQAVRQKEDLDNEMNAEDLSSWDPGAGR